MAYIANTAFEVKVSNHEFDSIANITGVFQSEGEDAICSSGFLCNRTGRTLNGYGGYNTNTWYMGACTTPNKNVPIYACNPFDVNMVTDPATGSVYKVGNNTLGIPAPAGYRTTYTQIYFNGVNVYRFGVGNVSGEVGANTFYFTIENGLLVPADTEPETADTPYFEALGTGSFTVGAYNAFEYVDVLAKLAAGNA